MPDESSFKLFFTERTEIAHRFLPDVTFFVCLFNMIHLSEGQMSLQRASRTFCPTYVGRESGRTEISRRDYYIRRDELYTSRVWTIEKKIRNSIGMLAENRKWDVIENGSFPCRSQMLQHSINRRWKKLLAASAVVSNKYLFTTANWLSSSYKRLGIIRIGNLYIL